MNRRQFAHKSMALAAVASLTASGAIASATSSKNFLVVGAGIAGLTAAHKLQANGHSVKVIEAQNRIGGRIKTDKRLGAAVDLGASWIHGVAGNPMTALANAIGAERKVTSVKSYTTFDHVAGTVGKIGQARSDRKDALDGLLQNWISSAQNADKDQSLYSAVWQRSDALSLPTADKQLLRHLLNASTEAEYGGNGTRTSTGVGDLSAHWFDSGKEFDGDDVVFSAGYQVIAQHLAQGLSIQMGERVTAIDYSGSGVAVTSDKGSYEVDRVIITVPLGVLKAGHIRFKPSLPAGHREAIDVLKMGLLNKLYLKFDTDFWTTSSNTDWIESICAENSSRQDWTQWVNFKRPIGQNILMGFNAADAAVETEGFSNETTVAAAMDRLKSMYGNSIPAPRGHLITRWWQDPYTLGSYSFNALGVAKNTRGQLATPIQNKLMFAGEAAHPDHASTVHAAHLSGLRAAQLLG